MIGPRGLLPAALTGPLLVGIDTSEAQSKLDVPAILATGIDFLVAKSADGHTSVDSEWETTAQACRDAVALFGAYAVIEPYGAAGVDAQVRNAVARIKGSGAAFWAADFELAKGETGLVALESCADYLDGLATELGPAGMLYSGPAFLEGLAKLAGPAAASVLARLAKWPLWCADYRIGRRAAAAPEVPPPFTDWTIWQLGPAGSTLPNGRTAVDLNVFRGDLAAFRAALGLDAAPPDSDAVTLPTGSARAGETP